MANALGYKVRGVLGFQSSYGTAVTADKILTFTSEEVSKVIAQIESQYNDGLAAKKSSDDSVVTVEGGISLQGVYDEVAGNIIGIDDILNLALGSHTFDTTHNEYHATKTGTEKIATIAFDKTVSVWELIGVKVNSLELKAQAGGALELTANISCKNIVRTGDGETIVNTTAAIAALAPTNDPEVITFDDLLFSVDATGAALTTADQKCISEFTLTIENGLSSPEHCTPGPSEALSNAKFPIESVQAGRRSVSLSVVYPRQDSDTEFTWHKNGTEVQAQLKFISSTKQFNIYLPRLKVTECTAPTPGPEPVKKNVTFMALRNNGTNDDMQTANSNNIVEEICIETKNARITAS